MDYVRLYEELAAARKALSKLLKGARAEKTESMLYYEVRSLEFLGVRKNDSTLRVLIVAES